MSVMIALAADARVSADDRGLNYGDGVFETLRFHDGKPVWWDAHWQRLVRGAAVLGIETAQADAVLAACAPLLAQPGDGVLKMLLTRGGGGSGDRKSAGSGKRVVVRVDLGSRRRIKKIKQY